MMTLHKPALLLLTAATAMITLASPGCNSKKGDPVVSGTLQIPAELQSKISPSAALYIIARPAGTQGGPPLAAQRVAQPFHFPVEFKLTQADSMVADRKFEGVVAVTARISQGGSASPAAAGDIEGVSNPTSVEIGSGKPVTIELKQVRP